MDIRTYWVTQSKSRFPCLPSESNINLGVIEDLNFLHTSLYNILYGSSLLEVSPEQINVITILYLQSV